MTLVYATGGLFYAERKFDVAWTCPGCAPPAAVAASGTGNSTGWTVGGGLEYALGGGWSAKGEYLYFDTGEDRNATIFYNYGAQRSSLTAHSAGDTGHVVRFGVNYKWGGGYGKAPVVAKY